MIRRVGRGSTAARTRRVSSRHTVQNPSDKRGVSDPPIGATGRLSRFGGGSLTPRLPLFELLRTSTRGTIRRSAPEWPRPRSHIRTTAWMPMETDASGPTAFPRLPQRAILLTPKVCGPCGSPCGLIRGEKKLTKGWSTSSRIGRFPTGLCLVVQHARPAPHVGHALACATATSDPFVSG